MENYKIGEELGKGSFAAVYKAQSKKTDEIVALKKFDKKVLLIDKTKQDNLISEITIMKRLSHPNLVQLLGFQSTANHVYLIMEYCSGGSLEGLLKKHGKFSEDMAKNCIQQISEGLRFLWNHSLIHRDLKPANILLKSRPKKLPIIKIADFGLAKELGKTEIAQGKVGTPLYMAPEIFSGQYDNKVDLWSVGIIYYELLTGKSPFASCTFTELISKLQDPELEIFYPVEISPSAYKFINNLLQRNPSNRISFEDYFCSDYLDLEHLPSSDSFEKGVFVIKEAINCDLKKKTQEALFLYQEGISYLLAAIQYEDDEKKISVLRAKCKSYIARAEELQKIEKKETTSGSDKRPELNGFVIPDTIKSSIGKISSIKKGTNDLEFARQLIVKAKEEEKNGSIKDALLFYEQSIGLFMNAIKNEKNNEMKNQLRNQVGIYLQQAEFLKKAVQKQKQQGSIFDELWKLVVGEDEPSNSSGSNETIKGTESGSSRSGSSRRSSRQPVLVTYPESQYYDVPQNRISRTKSEDSTSSSSKRQSCLTQ